MIKDEGAWFNDRRPYHAISRTPRCGPVPVHELRTTPLQASALAFEIAADSSVPITSGPSQASDEFEQHDSLSFAKFAPAVSAVQIMAKL
jgi:hypothetical protein